MNKNENFRGSMPQKKDSKREIRQDPETVKLANLINPLIEKHGRIPVMNYIEKNTLGEIAPNVVERWLNNQQTPSLSVQRDIMSTLREFQPDSLPLVKNNDMFTPKEKAARAAQSSNQSSRESSRDQIVKENERKLDAVMEKFRREGKII